MTVVSPAKCSTKNRRRTQRFYLRRSVTSRRCLSPYRRARSCGPRACFPLSLWRRAARSICAGRASALLASAHARDSTNRLCRRRADRPGLAFAGDTQPRSGIDARRNPQLNGLFAFEASLPAALRATLAHNLTRALARRACSRDGEESLLICQLTAAGARLAGLNASSLFRARAVARLAVFLARQLDFGGHARGGLFERERHVVSQIGPALRAAAPAAPAATYTQVLEAKKIAEDVVEILEDGAVKSLAGAAAGKARVTVGVVDLPLLRITQHAVGFGAFAKLYFRFGFVFRTAVGMPFQRRFAVGGLDLVHRRRSRHAQNFVVIPLIPLRHGNFRSPLVHSFFGCGIRMHRYTHHRGAQHASMKHISRLKHLQNGAVLVFCRFRAIHCLVKMRIKGFSNGIDALCTQLRHVIQKLLVDELKPFSVIVVLGFAVRRQSVLESVDHRNEPFDDAGGSALGIFKALLLDALAVVVKVGLPPQQRLAQFFKVCGEPGHFHVGFR